MYLLYFLLHIV